MKVCYNKLWKLLIDKGMKKSQLSTRRVHQSFLYSGNRESDPFSEFHHGIFLEYSYVCATWTFASVCMESISKI